MKTCANCNNTFDDNSSFCPYCGTPANAGGTQQNNGEYQNNQNNQYNYQNNYSDPYDHTAEFSKEDISGNKVIAMLVYLGGMLGIIIALIAASNSPYAAFHVRQALKFVVVEAIMSIAAVLLCWTFIVPIAFAIMSLVFFVIKIITFFQICSGKAIEPAIIRSLNFLR